MLYNEYFYVNFYHNGQFVDEKEMWRKCACDATRFEDFKDELILMKILMRIEKESGTIKKNKDGRAKEIKWNLNKTQVKTKTSVLQRCKGKWESASDAAF